MQNSTRRIISICLFTEKHTLFFITILMLVSAFFRFYNLNWGSPFYFHPDERNIAGVVASSSFTTISSFLKGTFAYGNFPILLASLIKSIPTPFWGFAGISDSFAESILILRFLSAFFSILLLPVIFFCGKFWSKKTAFLALLFSIFSVGFIQQAHFGTFDGFISFCSLTVFFLLLLFMQSKKIYFYYLALLFISLGAASKITLLILVAFPIIILLLEVKKKSLSWLKALRHIVVSLLLVSALTALFSPYYITTDFKNGLLNERGIVTGTTQVFYTQSFTGTKAVIFQFFSIFPFLANPLLTVIFIPSFFYLVFIGIKTRDTGSLLLCGFFLILFLPQAFLYAKWTRYMVPTLPFMYLICAIASVDFWVFLSKRRRVFIKFLLLSILIGVNSIFGISYFITAFVQEDTRIAAKNFSKQHIPPNLSILSEVYDLGITPFNGSFHNITLYNFYDLDNSSPQYTPQTLAEQLAVSDYIILPSQRILKARLQEAQIYPNGHDFYSALFAQTNGFQKIYETPCDIFCKITYLNNPVFSFEETANVFDRPTVFIFKKNENL
ncbi:hypothetical protein KKF69_08090 [Patescibacteria group bacterium]|nr:hypothetical protein [Patescibacteria group bacterium]